MLKSLLAAVVTLALLTCPFPARAYEKTILKVGMGDPIDSEMGAIGTRFKEVVEARSEGKVEVQLFPSGQLGDETEMIDLGEGRDAGSNNPLRNGICSKGKALRPRQPEPRRARRWASAGVRRTPQGCRRNQDR